LGGTPKNSEAKTCKIWLDFGRLQSLAANISGMDEDILIQNLTSTLCTTILPALGEKSLANFGLVITEISSEIVPTQIDFFGKPYFGP